MGTVLSATADQITEEKPAAAVSPGPPIAHSESVLVGTEGGGSGSVKRRGGRASHKKTKTSKKLRSVEFSKNKLFT